jgi:hypothetical protein
MVIYALLEALVRPVGGMGRSVSKINLAWAFAPSPLAPRTFAFGAINALPTAHNVSVVEGAPPPTNETPRLTSDNIKLTPAHRLFL